MTVNFLGITSAKGTTGTYPVRSLAAVNTVPPSINALGSGNLVPEVLNSNPYAGIVRCFDSFKCFGFEP